MNIQLRRGLEANRLSIVPKLGEPLFTTDTKKLYVGDGVTPGGIEVDTTGGGGGGAVDSVNAKTGVVVLTKSDIGLSNADNTSDANKPVSTATQTALNLKANTSSLATVATSGSYTDLTAKPTIPAQFAPVAGTNVTLTGTYPNITIAAAGGGGGAVSSVNTQTGVVVLTQDNIADGTTYKQYSATDKTKLAGIATSATANDTDVNLKARANHTGTQSADTITDGTTNKAFLATERTKLTGIATAATANSTDATLLARANHTGTQAQSTVTNLVTDLAGKANSTHTHAQSDVTNLVTDLAGKAATSHTHAQSDITSLTTDLAGKQAALVSGTTIKTINGTTLLGSGDIVISGGSGSGITRTVVSVTSAVTLGATSLTDYRVFVGASGVPTLPTAVGNTNTYEIKNVDTTSKTLSTTSSQTIDGSLTITLLPNEAKTIGSDGTNWQII